jgi:hypothetical protein
MAFVADDLTPLTPPLSFELVSDQVPSEASPNERGSAPVAASPKLVSRAKTGLLAILLGVATGCAGALEDPSRFDYLFQDGGLNSQGEGGNPGSGTCDPVTQIFPMTCATAPCHSAAAMQNHLDLQSPGLPERLVGKQAFGGPGLLIDPMNPDDSVLYLKVTSTPPFGFQMPLVGGPLSQDQVECIKTWVENAVTADE